MILMKSLKSGGAPRHYRHEGQLNWPLPKGDQPGAWFGPANGTLKPHANGFHLADLTKDAILWVDEENYVAELPYTDTNKAQREGNLVIDEDCVITREVRLTRRLQMSHQDWRALAFQLAEPVLRMPSYMGLPHEYEHSMANLFFYLRDGAAPFAQQQSFSAFLGSVDYLIDRAGTDRMSTLRYRDCPEAVCEAGKAIRALAMLQKKDVHPVKTVRLVADMVVRSYRFASLSFDAGDTSFTNHHLKSLMNYIPDDMPERYRGNIAHRTLYNLRKNQNKLLLKKFGLHISSDFHLTNSQGENRLPTYQLSD